jgi:hypothetical protein
MMRSLLVDILDALAKNQRVPADIIWIGTGEWCVTWDEFERLANQIFVDDQSGILPLMVRGTDFMLLRRACEVVDWWEFIPLHQPPKAKSLTIEMLQI